MIYDLVIEGAFQTLGFFTMAGGHLSFFPDTYEKFPVIETFFVATQTISLTALRYFKNEKGETFAERGINSMVISDGRKQLLRLLAIIGATQMIYLTSYNIPIATYMGANPGVWPTDVQSRPYLNDNLCGAGTDRLCPGPGVPLTQGAWVITSEDDAASNWIPRFFEPEGKALRAPIGRSVPEINHGPLRPFASRFMAFVSQ